MGRNPCSSKEGALNKGAWTAHEDKILSEYVKIHGEGRWRNLPKKAGLNRCGKSCRLRWLNYLRPDIKRGNISPDEEELIIRLHKLLGNRWSLIAGRLPGRTDNEIKNYWNTNLGKKIQDQQISPGGYTRKNTSVETNSISEMSTSNITINNNNNNHSSSLPSAPSGMATHVVRTKAIKCTKVVVSNDPPPSPPPHPRLAHNVDHFDPDKHTSPSSLDAHQLSDCYPLLLEANTLNGLSPSSFSTTTTTTTTTTTSQGDFSSTTDFIMNFNSTEELFLSNILNSDLFDYNDKYCNNSVLSTSLGDDQALMFSEDFLIQSWEYY